MMPPVIDRTASVPAEGLSVDGGTLKEPGFLRAIATVEHNGRTYRGLATAGFQPEAIRPTQQDPSDFDSFWTAAKPPPPATTTSSTSPAASASPASTPWGFNDETCPPQQTAQVPDWLLDALKIPGAPK
jgi:hypothetical protein